MTNEGREGRTRPVVPTRTGVGCWDRFHPGGLIRTGATVVVREGTPSRLGLTPRTRVDQEVIVVGRPVRSVATLGPRPSGDTECVETFDSVQVGLPPTTTTFFPTPPPVQDLS